MFSVIVNVTAGLSILIEVRGQRRSMQLTLDRLVNCYSINLYEVLLKIMEGVFLVLADNLEIKCYQIINTYSLLR